MWRSLLYNVYSYSYIYKSLKKGLQNLNYLIVKQVSSLKDLYRIMGEYTLGVEKDALKKLYENSTREKQDFLLVDLDASLQDRFRKNFNEIYDI